MPEFVAFNPKLGDAFVYVATIQRMAINLYGQQAVGFQTGDESADDDASKLDIPFTPSISLLLMSATAATQQKSSPCGATPLITSTLSRLD